MNPHQVLRELLRSKTGKLGVGFLFFLIALSIFTLVYYPLSFGRTKWSNPAVWADNPKAAPPVWTNLFPGSNRVPHRVSTLAKPTATEAGQTGAFRTYRLPITFDYDEPPTFVSFSVADVRFYQDAPVLTVLLSRPDGNEVPLYREIVRGPRAGESAPYARFDQESLRVSLASDNSAINAMVQLFNDEYGVNFSPGTLRPIMNLALFGIPDPTAPNGLKLAPGRYSLSLQAAFAEKRDSLTSVKFVVGGHVYGLMGTDGEGRDLAQGLLFGLPVALFIGIVASIVSTAIGATLGVVSGYAGGVTDLVIQRSTDIINNVPLLPLLIFFVFVFGSHLWLIMLILVAFSWPGLTILLRSMVLQVRSGQLVESAVAVGSSKWRIMYRHIFPQIAPFVIAQFIFFAPGAILAEAGLSFLGLGDPNIPTWGQILESGFRTGAVYLGYWWWVIPPGVLIIITAVTFMLLSLAMEPVLNPRLRRL